MPSFWDTLLGGGEQTTVTQQTPQIPGFIQQPLESVFARAGEESQRPYTPYQGPRIAPTSSFEQAGYGRLGQMFGVPFGQPQPQPQGQPQSIFNPSGPPTPMNQLPWEQRPAGGGWGSPQIPSPGAGWRRDPFSPMDNPRWTNRPENMDAAFEENQRRLGEAQGPPGQPTGIVIGGPNATYQPQSSFGQPQPQPQSQGQPVGVGSQGQPTSAFTLPSTPGRPQYEAPVDYATTLAASAGERGLDPGQFTDPGVREQYMSPYMEDVIRMSQDEAVRASHPERQALNTQAAQMGAWGGGRHNVLEAERQRNLSRLVSDIGVRGRQSAFENAQSQYERDRGARLAGLNPALSASGQIGNLATTGQTLGLQGVNAITAAGQAQRGTQQSSLDLAYQDFLNQRNDPRQQIQFLSDIIRGNQLPAGQTTTQTTQGGGPSVLSQLGGIGLGAYTLFGPGRAKGGPIKSSFADGGKVEASEEEDERYIKNFGLSWQGIDNLLFGRTSVSKMKEELEELQRAKARQQERKKNKPKSVFAYGGPVKKFQGGGGVEGSVRLPGGGVRVPLEQQAVVVGGRTFTMDELNAMPLDKLSALKGISPHNVTIENIIRKRTTENVEADLLKRWKTIKDIGGKIVPSEEERVSKLFPQQKQVSDVPFGPPMPPTPKSSFDVKKLQEGMWKAPWESLDRERQLGAGLPPPSPPSAPKAKDDIYDRLESPAFAAAMRMMGAQRGENLLQTMGAAGMSAVAAKQSQRKYQQEQAKEKLEERKVKADESRAETLSKQAKIEADYNKARLDVLQKGAPIKSINDDGNLVLIERDFASKTGYKETTFKSKPVELGLLEQKQEFKTKTDAETAVLRYAEKLNTMAIGTQAQKEQLFVAYVQQAYKKFGGISDEEAVELAKMVGAGMKK